MLRSLPPALRGVLTGTLLVANTLFVSLLMVAPALLKLVAGPSRVRKQCDRALNALASRWVAVNNAWIAAVSPQAWDVEGIDGLHRNGWYLVSLNHQSWVDILVLQRVFHGRIPFLKFFLKRELFWVPVIGLVWWALDFPFMARGKGSGTLQADLQATRESCEKFRRLPTTVINFLEGTRLTTTKHAAQRSTYRHLLKPRTGGLGVALATMGDMFEALLDVTIVYPDGVPTFWDLLCGRAGKVIVRVRQQPIPPALLAYDLENEKAPSPRQLMRWVDGQWRDKDQLIEALLAVHGPRTAQAPH